MSSRIERAPALLDLGTWLVLAVLLTVVLLGNWLLAAGLLLLFLAQLARPFDVIVAFLLVVSGAAFVKNSGGGLTTQLGLFVALILLMLVCYVLTNPNRVFSLPRTALTKPLGWFMILSFLNTARGLLWNDRRYLGLELLPLLGLGSALLVGNVFDRRRDLYISVAGLVVLAYTRTAVSLSEGIAQLHRDNTYIEALPGLVALLLVNLALRAPRLRVAVLWVALALPLFFQQLLTLGRGLWTGSLGGLAFSFLVYGGFGRGSGARWRRSGVVILATIVLGLFGVSQAAVFLGRGDLFQDVGARWATTTSTNVSYETRSNLIRLWEYATAFGQIRNSPWIGHGLGFAFTNKEPFTGKTFDQWYVHQSYLMTWLKQGLVGLALFVWLLWSAIRMGAKGARREQDPWSSAWFATTGAATVFMAVFSLSNFPFGVVNEMFLLAFLWGGSMAMAREGFLVLRWRPAGAEMLELPRGHTAPAPIDPTA